MKVRHRFHGAPRMGDGYRLRFEGELRSSLAERFATEAERRGKSPAELAADLLQAIIEDNLFAAVLDG